MVYSDYTKIGEKEGGIRFNPEANSYVVWIRENVGEKQHDLMPAYGNGIDAQNRLAEELLK